jgi:hypothetical protein
MAHGPTVLNPAHFPLYPARPNFTPVDASPLRLTGWARWSSPARTLRNSLASGSSSQWLCRLAPSHCATSTWVPPIIPDLR